MTIASSAVRVPITIPGSGTTTGATLRSLLATGGLVTSGGAIGVKILGLAIGGANRAAFDVANEATAAAFTAHAQRVAAAADYYEPVAVDLDSAVRAAAAGSVAAVAVVYLG